jgi:hypothetical protein
VAEAQLQFGKAEEGENPPLEAGTRGMLNRQQAKKTQCVP